MRDFEISGANAAGRPNACTAPRHALSSLSKGDPALPGRIGLQRGPTAVIGVMPVHRKSSMNDQ